MLDAKRTRPTAADGEIFELVDASRGSKCAKATPNACKTCEKLRSRRPEWAPTDDAFSVAVRAGCAGCVRAMIVTNRGHILNTTSMYGETALHAAARCGDVEVMRLIIEAQVDVNVGRKDGATALFVAAREGSLDAVRLLLNAGARTNVSDLRGETSLHFGARSKDPRVVHALVTAGENIDAENIDGQTPLHVAIAARHDEIIESLVALGACVHQTDVNGRICFAEAIKMSGLANPLARTLFTGLPSRSGGGRARRARKEGLSVASSAY